jgi:hypothetical protein
MSAVYRIQDEPTGHRSHALIVNPFWALLALMLGGAWLSALMYSANAILLRGPTWQREVAFAGLMLLGAPLILIGLVQLAPWLPQRSLSYLYLTVTLWKLGMCYWLFFLQQNTYALYEYFGGTAPAAQRGSAGMVLVVVGVLARSTVLGVVDSPLWREMVR